MGLAIPAAQSAPCIYPGNFSVIFQQALVFMQHLGGDERVELNKPRFLLYMPNG